MFPPLACYIGLRYTRAKRRSHFVSFITLVSLLGITLGVAVLITVLSVMNGFDHEMRTKLFSEARQVVVTPMDGGGLNNWEPLAQTVAKQPDVVAVAPYVDGQSMLTHRGAVVPLILTGILPEREKNVISASESAWGKQFSKLRSGYFGVLLPDVLAESLGVTVGSRVTLVTPEPSLTPVGVLPRFKRFIVIGIFHADRFGGSRAFIHLHDAQTLFKLGRTVTGIRLKVNGLYKAPEVAWQISQHISSDYVATDWTQRYSQLFKAIRLEKTMMFLVLFLIVIVAVFNLVSSLVMVVTDKRADIAILRTLGATPSTIIAIFIIQGAVIGLLGTALGILSGILLSLNATAVVTTIEAWFHIQFLSSAIYMVDFLPSQLLGRDVVMVGGVSLLLSLVATLYPAWQAARVQPAEALRYE